MAKINEFTAGSPAGSDLLLFDKAGVGYSASIDDIVDASSLKGDLNNLKSEITEDLTSENLFNLNSVTMEDNGTSHSVANNSLKVTATIESIWCATETQKNGTPFEAGKTYLIRVTVSGIKNSALPIMAIRGTERNERGIAKSISDGTEGTFETLWIATGYEKHVSFFVTSTTPSNGAEAVFSDVSIVEYNISAIDSKARESISLMYDDLSYPIFKGTSCWYEGKQYVSTQSIFSKESFDSTKWVEKSITSRIDSLEKSRVNGMPSWEDSLKVTYTNKLICFRQNNGTPVYEIDYTSGIYLKCFVEGFSSVRIKGYGFDLSSNLCLWIFTDRKGNQISHDTIDQHGGDGWVNLNVPDGAIFLYVNGATNKVPNAQNIVHSIDFKESYNLVKQSETFKLIALGDSITALHLDDNGWLKYFLEKTNGTLIANVASGGACLHDYSNTVYDGNPTISTPSNNVLGNEVQKILNNQYDEPDLIMIAVGTNGGINITEEEIKSVYYDSNDNLIPLTNVDRTTDAGAYRYCTETLHNTYPNATIVWCSPIYASQEYRKMADVESWSKSLEIATKFTGQYYIDTLRCGINGIAESYNENGEYLEDGLHPNVKGAKRIGYYNAGKILQFIGGLIYTHEIN